MHSGKQRIPPAQPDTAYLSSNITFGMHLYRAEGEDCSVYYMDDARGIKRLVVDENGRFCDFPIVITEEFWVCKLQDTNALKNQIRFRTSFEKTDGGFVVLWNIQPDGRYWEDADGYGSTTDLEIILYSFLDTEGKICAPFRIYRLGTEVFYTSQPQPAQEQVKSENVLVEGEKKTTAVFREIMWIVTLLGNAAIVFIIGLLSTEYDSYYGKRNPYGSVFEYMSEDILWIFAIILLLFNVIFAGLAIIPHDLIQKSSITLTGKRIFGTSTAGKQFDIAVPDIRSVHCKKGKVTVVAKTGKVSLYCLQNAKELCDAVSGLIGISVQPTQARKPKEQPVRKAQPVRPPKTKSRKEETVTAPVSEEAVVDVAEKIKKLDQLRNDGVLTQKEFEKLKKLIKKL